MKRNLVIVLLLVVFTTMEMRAQEWTTTGTTVHPITLTNNVGIGTSNAKGMLHFANGYGNRRIVLFVNQDNDNEFYGFGMSPSTLRFQIPTASNYFRFYAGNGANASNEIAVLTGGGALGLGITQPAARIHVNSSVPRILMSDQDEPVSSSNPAWAVRAENTSGSFIIQNTTQSDYAVFTDNLRITPAGTVGIGTNSPSSSYKLDVNGALRTAKNIVANEHITVQKSGSYRIALNGQTHGYIVGRNDSAQAKFTISAQGATYFSGGNVGIGLSSPKTKFHITNSQPFDKEMAGVGQDHILFSSPDPGNGAEVYFGGLTWESLNRRRASISAVREPSDSDKIGLAFFTRGTDGIGPFAESMRITWGGKVGIGTTVPDEALTVKGNIHTNEVRVDTEPEVVPDYVFEEDYKLLSLEQTEAYIKEHKHLPDVPSAAELGENGMNLKEMNLILLKKIEELTLHVIEQNMQLQQQSILISEQNKRLEKLEGKSAHRD